MKKLKKNFVWIPIALMGISVVAKIFGLTQGADVFPDPRLAEKLVSILTIEVICLAFFILPKTRKIGFFLICSYLGGAIAVDLIYGISSPLFPSFILILFWISMYLDNRDFFINEVKK
jgi:hypothetical protein